MTLHGHDDSTKGKALAHHARIAAGSSSHSARVTAEIAAAIGSGLRGSPRRQAKLGRSWSHGRATRAPSPLRPAASLGRTKVLMPRCPPGVSVSWLTASAAKTGGEGGIRTLGDLAATHDFQSCAFDHSATSPSSKRRANKGCSPALGQRKFLFGAKPHVAKGTSPLRLPRIPAWPASASSSSAAASAA